MKIKLMSAAAALLASAGPAFAADIYNTTEPPAPYEVTSEPPVDWSGPYVGARLGYGHANHNLTINEYFRDYCGDSVEPDEHGIDDEYVGNRLDFLVDDTLVCSDSASWNNQVVSGASREIGNVNGLSSHGVIGGLKVGVDQQMGDWVVGAFGTYDFTNMETTATFDDFSARIEKGDEWSLGLRGGPLLNERTLLYGAVAYTNTDYNFLTSPEVEGLRNNVTFEGISFGGGIEHALKGFEGVFVGIEGMHTIYRDETIFDSYDSDFNQGINVVDDLSETKIMGTLKIKLNGMN